MERKRMVSPPHILEGEEGATQRCPDTDGSEKATLEAKQVVTIVKDFANLKERDEEKAKIEEREKVGR
jgi:hypothetical protein